MEYTDRQTDRRSSSSKVQTCVRDTAEPSVAATSDAAVFASYIHTRMRDDMMVATCAFTRTVLLLLVLLVVLATAGTHVVVLRRCPSLHPSVDDIVWWCTRTFFESFYYSGILWYVVMANILLHVLFLVLIIFFLDFPFLLVTGVQSEVDDARF